MAQAPSSIHRRLQLIDQYLAYRGKIGRADLINHFDIGIATASRTFKEYRRQYPNNLAYSVSDRLYVAAPQFTPAFPHDVDKALALIAYGLDVREIEGARFGQLSPQPVTAPLSSPVVSAVTRAMVNQEAIHTEYASGSSGISSRLIAPHALFQGGGAWYVRAFDNHHCEFRTFRLSRIRRAEASRSREAGCSSDKDSEWRSSVILTLAPHPSRDNQDALREDLGLKGKPVTNVEVNAVTAGFVLIDLRVDCSLDGSLNPYEYHLRLMNRHDLEAVSSMSIAPGFRTHKLNQHDS